MPLRASLIPPAKREPSHETLKASRSARSEIRCSPIDVGQATQRVVVVQVNAGAAEELRIPPIRLGSVRNPEKPNWRPSEAEIL